MRVRQSPLNWNFNSETHSKPVTVGSHQFIQKYSLVNALRRMSLQFHWLESGATKKSATLPPLLTNSKVPQIIRITGKAHSQSVQLTTIILKVTPRIQPPPSSHQPLLAEAPRQRSVAQVTCRTMHNISCRWKNPLPS